MQLHRALQNFLRAPQKLLRAVAALLLFFPASAFAALDLHALYQIALEKDAVYRAAHFEYERARRDFPLAVTALLPSVSLQATASETSDTTGNETTRTRDNTYGVSAKMPLFDRVLHMEVGRTKLLAANAEVTFWRAREELILRVAGAYFDLLAARDSKEVARAALLAIARQRDLAKERLEVGLGTRTDLLDAEARYQQAVADDIGANNAIVAAEMAVKTIIGYVPGALAPLGEDAPLAAPQPASLAHWVEAALAGNLALRAAVLQEKIAAAEMKKIRGAAWPNISLDANAQKNDNDDGGSTDGGGMTPADETSSVKATLNWTFFSSGALFYKSKQAAAQRSAAVEARKDMRRRVEAGASAAYLTAASGIDRVKALSEAVRAGASALQAKEEGFRAGLTTNIDVLDAQRDHSGARTSHLRARYDFILSLLQLEQNAGHLDEEDVRRINQLLGAN